MFIKTCSYYFAVHFVSDILYHRCLPWWNMRQCIFHWNKQGFNHHQFTPTGGEFSKLADSFCRLSCLSISYLNEIIVCFITRYMHALLRQVWWCLLISQNQCATSAFNHDVIMETFSAVLSLCVRNPPITGGFSAQRDNNGDLWCFFVVSLNKLLNKHSIGRQFEVPWRLFDVAVTYFFFVSQLKLYKEWIVSYGSYFLRHAEQHLFHCEKNQKSKHFYKHALK